MHRQPTSHPQRHLANLCTCQKPISYLDLRAAVHNLNNQPFGRKCSYAAIPPAVYPNRKASKLGLFHIYAQNFIESLEMSKENNHTVFLKS